MREAHMPRGARKRPALGRNIRAPTDGSRCQTVAFSPRSRDQSFGEIIISPGLSAGAEHVPRDRTNSYRRSRSLGKEATSSPLVKTTLPTEPISIPAEVFVATFC